MQRDPRLLRRQLPRTLDLKVGKGAIRSLRRKIYTRGRGCINNTGALFCSPSCFTSSRTISLAGELVAAASARSKIGWPRRITLPSFWPIGKPTNTAQRGICLGPASVTQAVATGLGQ